ncbi:Mur ligase domain-containing protein [Priestia koreensis]|uniref:Mur ligase domain-containing protein n=1 Tax=Priestia koreensis TaxID=284581 RepID=UPI001F572255|nr:Mur ligase domain-containing protein [Priestia koreensis]
MFQRTVQEISTMLNQAGNLPSAYKNIHVKGVSIDSRTLTPGNLYAPIVRVKNGHDYVKQAIGKGASAVLWKKNEQNPPSDVPVIYV